MPARSDSDSDSNKQRTGRGTRGWMQRGLHVLVLIRSEMHKVSLAEASTGGALKRDHGYEKLHQRCLYWRLSGSSGRLAVLRNCVVDRLSAASARRSRFLGRFRSPYWRRTKLPRSGMAPPGIALTKQRGRGRRQWQRRTSSSMLSNQWAVECILRRDNGRLCATVKIVPARRGQLSGRTKPAKRALLCGRDSD